MFYVYLSEPHVDKTSGAESNAVQITVDYWKGRGAVMNIIGVMHQKGDPEAQFSYMPIGSPKTSHVLFPMDRDNKKKITEELQRLKEEVGGKAGPTWDKIVEFAETHGMKLEG